jgi:REP element-mobilizing transposase RayT
METMQDGDKNEAKRYDPEIHHRRSVRLKGYDYSSTGTYFVTICVQDRAGLLGRIAHGQIILNEAGEMIEHWWNEMKNKYASIVIDGYMIMPNHFHGIIRIVGADLCVCPDNDTNSTKDEQNEIVQDSQPIKCEHTGSPLRRTTISNMVQWFKTMSTNEYIRHVKHDGWPAFSGRLWQRNYYEHIIHGDRALRKIRKYITDNPKFWESDLLNPQCNDSVANEAAVIKNLIKCDVDNSHVGFSKPID